MRASGGGNVVGYNYMEDGWIRYNPGWMEVGLNASHMTTPHFELFEGNASFNFDGDNTWGNAVFITVFRNHLTGKRRSFAPLQLTDVQNRRAIGLMRGTLVVYVCRKRFGHGRSRCCTVLRLSVRGYVPLARQPDRYVAAGIQSRELECAGRSQSSVDNHARRQLRLRDTLGPLGRYSAPDHSELAVPGEQAGVLWQQPVALGGSGRTHEAVCIAGSSAIR